MASKVTGSTGFLIDGYPLDLEEAEKFEKQVVPVTRYFFKSNFEKKIIFEQKKIFLKIEIF